MKTRLIYIVQAGEWSDSGQAMVEALPALAERFDLVVFAPPLAMRPALASHGMRRRTFLTPFGLLLKLFKELSACSDAVLVCSSVSKAFAAALLARLSGTRLIQLQEGLCDGEDGGSRPRKRWLNRLPVLQLATSTHEADRLRASGVDAGRIHVVEPSLPHWLPGLPVKSAHSRSVRRVMLCSSFDESDGLDLLLQALAAQPRLNQIEFHVYGTGSQHGMMRHAAAARGLNVLFMGSAPRVMQFMSFYDAWLQTGDTPCDLATLSAMAVGLPVIVPVELQAGGVFENDVSALCFAGNDTADLIRVLRELQVRPAQSRQRMADEGQRRVLRRFGPAAIAENYRIAVHKAHGLLPSDVSPSGAA